MLWVGTIGVDLAGILGRGAHGEGRRWIGAERSRVWGGVSLLQPTRGSGERREQNGFWRILKATECSFCIYMTKSEGDNLR